MKPFPVYCPLLGAAALLSGSQGCSDRSVNHDIVSNLDFAGTFLDAAGIAIPPDMQGKSLMPLLKGETPSGWRTEHYYHYCEFPGWHSVKRHYGISTERYKLIHFYYNIDEWEMFDLLTDPGEMKNVYNDPAYSAVRNDLTNRLENSGHITGIVTNRQGNTFR